MNYFSGKTPKLKAKTGDHNVIIPELSLKHSRNKNEDRETKFNFNDAL